MTEYSALSYLYDVFAVGCNKTVGSGVYLLENED